MASLWQDLKYGIRMLAKNPGFTAVAVLTLALGIGANTAIFSVVNGVLLRPLPFRESARLVSLRETVGKGSINPVAYPNYLDWRAASQSFEEMAAFTDAEFILRGKDAADRIFGEQVTPNYFSLLGVTPALGRAFLPEENETPLASPVAMNLPGRLASRTAVTGAKGLNFVSGVAVSSSGNYLYAVNFNASAMTVLDISGKTPVSAGVATGFARKGDPAKFEGTASLLGVRPGTPGVDFTGPALYVATINLATADRTVANVTVVLDTVGCDKN